MDVIDNNDCHESYFWSNSDHESWVIKWGELVDPEKPAIAHQI